MNENLSEESNFYTGKTGFHLNLSADYFGKLWYSLTLIGCGHLGINTLNKKLKSKLLQLLQNKCTPFFFNLSNRVHIGLTELEKINWLPVNVCFKQCICLFQTVYLLTNILIFQQHDSFIYQWCTYCLFLLFFFHQTISLKKMKNAFLFCLESSFHSWDFSFFSFYSKFCISISPLFYLLVTALEDDWI